MNYSKEVSILASSDPKLAKIIEKIGECPLTNPVTETALVPEITKAIISQQISVKAAKTIYSRLEQLYPHGIEAHLLLNTPTETLHSLGISRPKITYLQDLAQKVIDGFPTVAELNTLTDAEIIQTLTQIKGVGTWTGQMFLIFRLHRLDVFPVDDLGIRKSIQKMDDLSEIPNKITLNEIGDKWKPYRSIACWYLWRSLDFKQE
ncbi:MAG: DNA-3-methyladenine glycosylase [Oscillatoria sp. PMC 1068.18]|nr:DNA-3-methyladenine glycosylase [Oscillatoria sp. PMC 1076.18]MEC4988946.1 DNA-3-methyladenine glycosylase [Oscillatoria sp. PMC 1068.18]